MNGIESLLLIIVGILSIWFLFYMIEEEEIPSKGWKKKMFLLIAVYAWIAFVTGNMMFFLWLFNE